MYVEEMHYREDNCVSSPAQQITSFKKAPRMHAAQESCKKLQAVATAERLQPTCP